MVDSARKWTNAGKTLNVRGYAQHNTHHTVRHFTATAGDPFPNEKSRFYENINDRMMDTP